jgi:hypothetical protein
LICIDEANGKENHENNDILKNMITSQTFVCESKGENAFMMRCNNRFIFTTNNSNPVKISSDSRRFAVFEVSSELKGDTTYFEEFSKVIGDKRVQADFYEFLMRRDLSKRDWINDRPMTEGFSRMVHLNLAPEQLFLRDYLSGCEGARLEIRATELYQEFVTWLRLNNPTYKGNGKIFGMMMSDMILSDKNKVGFKSLSKQRMTKGIIYNVNVTGGLIFDMNHVFLIVHGGSHDCV